MKITPIIIVIFVLLVIVLVVPRLPYASSVPSRSVSVVDVWHIDSFEGGVGSRASYLEKCLRQSVDKYVYINMYSYTPTQAIAKLAEGHTFDIISFSSGVGNSLLSYLAKYTGEVPLLSTNMLSSGMVDGDIVALPFMTGVYGLFARPSQLGENDILLDALTISRTIKVGKNTLQLQPLVCGFASSNNPLQSLALQGVGGSYQPNYQLTQYQAYEQFVSGKCATVLLGTQRDMYRLNNRMEQGRIEQLVFHPMDSYTDLVQYVALSTTADSSLCNDMIASLFDDINQDKLSTIGMLSVTGVNSYGQGSWWYDASIAIKNAVVPNVFTDSSQLIAFRQSAVSRLAENKL